MDINELSKLGIAHRDAKAAYEKAARNYIRSVKPMSEAKFWPMVDVFAESLHRFIKIYKREHKVGITEFVRGHLFDAAHSCRCNIPKGGFGDYVMGQWHELVAFLAQYERQHVVAYNAMKNWEDLDRGDDGFGDLCDSMPLAGGDIFRALREGDIANAKQLTKALKALDEKEKHPGSKFILDGENYIRMFLEEALSDYFIGTIKYNEEEEDAA